MANFGTIGIGIGTLVIGSVLAPIILAFSPASTLEGLVISSILIIAGLYILYMGVKGREVG